MRLFFTQNLQLNSRYPFAFYTFLAITALMLTFQFGNAWFEPINQKRYRILSNTIQEELKSQDRQ